MSVIPHIPAPVYPTEPVFPLSVEQYHQMIEIGALSEDDPVELIEGVLVFKMPKNKAHAIAVSRILSFCVKAVPAKWVVRAQDPITLGDSEPEPDIVIASAAGVERAAAHPTPADIALVIEVSDSSLDLDRNRKLRIYARAGIPHYWIVNLIDRQLELFADPAGDDYRQRDIATLEQTVQLPAALRNADVEVGSFFPPVSS